MTFPEPVYRIVSEAAATYQQDIERAVDKAERLIRGLPEFDGMVAGLVRNAIREMIHFARHKFNVQMRREAGSYGGPAKVSSGGSASVSEAYESLYTYRIAGTTLGMLKGADLDGIAESEQAISEGHLFNTRLCRRLAKLVPSDQTVQDVVSEIKLRKIFKEEQKRVKYAAAAMAGD